MIIAVSQNARKVGEVGMIREYVVKVTDTFLPGAFQRFESEWAPEQELIRCKDCKHGSLYCTEDVCSETLIECNRPDLGDVIEIHGWKWFCADGERRTDDA